MSGDEEFSESTALNRLRYLQVLRYLVGDQPASVYFIDLDKPIDCEIDGWCPGELIEERHSDSDGVLCVKNLKTPIGTLSKARLRESDIIALHTRSPLPQ
ncbi:unnamed protein product [Calicophoron daubneyi]|uniref:Uncharacterized protein n=1 Tax=Calicophoron daubneyi TaxID=300641 RepID=A0AAV2TJM6_CALDB